MKVAVVVGNPKSQSRTAFIAMSLADQLFGKGRAEITLTELSSYADRLFKWPCEEMLALNRQVAESNVAVFASPTYKAAYTGLLKAFLDRYPANGLSGVVALPVMTGADLAHSLAPTTTLIPLLLELGAIVPTTGLYFNTAHYHKIDAQIAERLDEVVGRFNSLRLVLEAQRAGQTPSDISQGA